MSWERKVQEEMLIFVSVTWVLPKPHACTECILFTSLFSPPATLGEGRGNPGGGRFTSSHFPDEKTEA